MPVLAQVFSTQYIMHSIPLSMVHINGMLKTSYFGWFCLVVLGISFTNSMENDDDDDWHHIMFYIIGISREFCEITSMNIGQTVVNVVSHWNNNCNCFSSPPFKSVILHIYFESVVVVCLLCIYDLFPSWNIFQLLCQRFTFSVRQKPKLISASMNQLFVNNWTFFGCQRYKATKLS